MAPKIASYMSRPVITASKDENLFNIRELMIKHKISKVVITEGNSVAGIVSKSDFIRILYNKKRYAKPLTRIYAYEIMSSPVYAVQPAKTIKAAASAMLRRNIGSLLVIENGRLLGIITKADLVRAYSEKYIGRHTVSDFMQKRVPVVSPSHTIYYVINLMQDAGIGKAIVVDKGKVVGVITKLDIMFLGINPLRHDNVKIIKKMGLTGGEVGCPLRICAIPLAADIMTQNPLTIGPNEDLALAADIMVKHRIGTLPVVNDDGELIGTLTKNCVIRALKYV